MCANERIRKRERDGERVRERGEGVAERFVKLVTDPSEETQSECQRERRERERDSGKRCLYERFECSQEIVTLKLKNCERVPI